MKKDPQYVDEDFIKTFISQGLPIKRDKQNKNEKNSFLRENEPTFETPKSKEVLNRKRREQTDYRETYFEKVDMTDRKSLYITSETHLILIDLKNIIGGHKATISGYVDNIIRQHLESHKEEINSLYENQFRNRFLDNKHNIDNNRFKVYQHFTIKNGK